MFSSYIIGIFLFSFIMSAVCFALFNGEHIIKSIFSLSNALAVSSACSIPFLFSSISAFPCVLSKTFHSVCPCLLIKFPLYLLYFLYFIKNVKISISKNQHFQWFEYIFHKIPVSQLILVLAQLLLSLLLILFSP